jgi:integrase
MIRMKDTKNRREHVIYLSTQALKIAKEHAKGKKPGDRLFDIGDPRKTLAAINDAVGVTCTPKTLRSTFATIAAELVPHTTLQRMVNHTAQDVTSTHYVAAGEKQLRDGWQRVADTIEELAKKTRRRV